MKEIKVPQPDEISHSEKEAAGISYIMMFATLFSGIAIFGFNLLISFIYYKTNKKKSRFVAFHCYQSLSSQLASTLSLFGMVVLGIISAVAGAFDTAARYRESAEQGMPLIKIFIICLVLVLISNLVYVIVSIIAMIRAYNGRFYYMPFFGKRAFEKFYGPNSTWGEDTKPENAPPA